MFEKFIQPEDDVDVPFEVGKFGKRIVTHLIGSGDRFQIVDEALNSRQSRILVNRISGCRRIEKYATDAWNCEFGIDHLWCLLSAAERPRSPGRGERH